MRCVHVACVAGWLAVAVSAGAQVPAAPSPTAPSPQPSPPAGEREQTSGAPDWTSTSTPTPDPGVPVTLAAGLDLGWTNQITGGSAMAAEVEFGLLFRPGPLRLGLLGHLGLRGELASFGVDVAAGPSFAPQPGTRIDVLALLGLQGFVRSDSSSFLGQRTVTGGSATLPAAGLRVVSGPEDGRGLSLGLQAQLLLGTDRGTYTTRDCFLFGCTETVHPYRFDGVMVGLILQYGNTFRSPPAAPGASPTPPGTPEPPPATRWNGGAP